VVASSLPGCFEVLLFCCHMNIITNAKRVSDSESKELNRISFAQTTQTTVPIGGMAFFKDSDYVELFPHLTLIPATDSSCYPNLYTTCRV
jgi:hypothetical protein